MYINKRSKKNVSKELEIIAEKLWLSEQVLYDLKKDYRRAIGNGLFTKAVKTKIDIDKVTLEIDHIKKQIEEIERLK